MSDLAFGRCAVWHTVQDAPQSVPRLGRYLSGGTVIRAEGVFLKRVFEAADIRPKAWAERAHANLSVPR